MAQLPPTVTAVTVAVDLPNLADVARGLLARGLHVLVEKPMAPDAATAQALVAAAEAWIACSRWASSSASTRPWCAVRAPRGASSPGAWARRARTRRPSTSTGWCTISTSPATCWATRCAWCARAGPTTRCGWRCAPTTGARRGCARAARPPLGAAWGRRRAGRSVRRRRSAGRAARRLRRRRARRAARSAGHRRRRRARAGAARRRAGAGTGRRGVSRRLLAKCREVSLLSPLS
ncbi:MAG: Gfo/Idh/MocA family oxidoreductase [Myxococcales bacterium]|nr:Gfo/Idh/MocA family oxidoreductase [Myxococcales bacterium]